MQNFNDEWGKKRIVTIQNMTSEDVRDFYLQDKTSTSKTKERKIRDLKQHIREIKQNKKEAMRWILSIKDKRNKIVGKIEIFDIGVKKAFISIEIPNESWRVKYGTEAVNQIIKICKQHKCFDIIELEAKNEIVESYIKQRGLPSYIV